MPLGKWNLECSIIHCTCHRVWKAKRIYNYKNRLNHPIFIHDIKYDTINETIHHKNITIHHKDTTIIIIRRDIKKGNVDEELQPQWLWMDLNGKSIKHYHLAAWNLNGRLPPHWGDSLKSQTGYQRKYHKYSLSPRNPNSILTQGFQDRLTSIPKDTQDT